MLLRMTDTSRPHFQSVFDSIFDVAVFGAGLAGYAAAWEFARRGSHVLLVESSADLLWEATRSLENSTESAVADMEWPAWIEVLRSHNAVGGGYFNPAVAEVLAAHELTTASVRPETLLYASPVAVETGEGGLTGVIVATKGGARRVRARRWIDATEQGFIARLACPSLSSREPQNCFRSLVLRAVDAGRIDSAFPTLAARYPGLELWKSWSADERRLRWPESLGLWHQIVPAIISELRGMLGGDAQEFVVTHCAMNVFPVYAASLGCMSGELPANLLVASPALVGDALVTPADRFRLGVQAAVRAAGIPESMPERGRCAPAVLPPPAEELPAGDVVVAGTGTGGALAAISAAAQGARTLAFDLGSYPGGVGTGGGICGYFHGAKGGLQSEIDLRVQAMTILLTGCPAGLSGWHHEAKKIVLLQWFDEVGVAFLGDALLAGVERDGGGRVAAVLLAAGGRLVRLAAQAFIDATGDGDLAAQAGAAFHVGRPGDGRTLSYSQSVYSLVRDEESEEQTLRVRSCNFDAGWVDPNDPDDLTHARLAGIAQHQATLASFGEKLLSVSPLLGLRQSRQIVTDRMVRLRDLTEGACFEDSIGEVATVADTHSVDYEFESDDLAFYYWTCRGFRLGMRCDLPYGMMLPRGIENVWLACRAAGIEVDAAYGLRMQREMQRLGEAAGIAAALAARDGAGSRNIDLAALFSALERSGSRPAAREPDAGDVDLLAALDTGLPGAHLWKLSGDAGHYRDGVISRLHAADSRVSFYAAAVLAMWDEASAESRLMAALTCRETGPTPEEKPVTGAFGQCIDLPFWLQAVVLLRRVGGVASLPALRSLAETPCQPLNVRTILALTLERIAARIGFHHDLTAALDALLADDLPDPVLPPSRSLWNTLHGMPQKRLGNERGANVSQDHTWQLHLIVARARAALGLDPQAGAALFSRDSRALVRKAFVPGLSGKKEDAGEMSAEPALSGH